jgi:hypothetical protein
MGWNTIGTPGRAEPQRLGKSSPRRLSPGPHQEQQPLPAEQNDQPVRVSTSYIAQEHVSHMQLPYFTNVNLVELKLLCDRVICV